MINIKEKLEKIIGEIKDSGYGEEVPTTAIRNAIMRNAGISKDTLQCYTAALQAFNYIKKSPKTGNLWVILDDSKTKQ